jgi:hypothetical protein
MPALAAAIFSKLDIDIIKSGEMMVYSAIFTSLHSRIDAFDSRN